MSTQDEQMARITAVQTRYADELMRKKHVVGVAVGLAQRDGEYTQEVALVVMVEQKVPLDQLAPEDRIPSELDGVPVDVQETGTFEAQ
jgi:hypothetical protein